MSHGKRFAQAESISMVQRQLLQIQDDSNPTPD
jgi:hypothetical protein